MSAPRAQSDLHASSRDGVIGAKVRVRAWALGLLALAFYVGIIAWYLVRSGGGA